MSNPEDVSIATKVDPLLLFHGDEVEEEGLVKEDLDDGEEDFVGFTLYLEKEQVSWKKKDHSLKYFGFQIPIYRPCVQAGHL